MSPSAPSPRGLVEAQCQGGDPVFLLGQRLAHAGRNPVDRIDHTGDIGERGDRIVGGGADGIDFRLDILRRPCGLAGELLDLVGDDREAPLPASPARAASIVALSASRFVRSATARIASSMPSIRSAEPESRVITASAAARPAPAPPSLTASVRAASVPREARELASSSRWSRAAARASSTAW